MEGVEKGLGYRSDAGKITIGIEELLQFLTLAFLETMTFPNSHRQYDLVFRKVYEILYN